MPNGLCFPFKGKNVLQLQTDLSEVLWYSKVTHHWGQYKASTYNTCSQPPHVQNNHSIQHGKIIIITPKIKLRK